MVTLQFQQLVVHPGQRIQLQGVSWSEFEAILKELGHKRAARIAYSDGVLEIRQPLLKHEKAKVLIGDMVKILLEELDIDNECFGSTTFKRQDIAKKMFVNTNCTPIRPLNPPELGDFEQKRLESPPELGGWGASARLYANLQTLSKGIEPGQCFYIENAAQMIGKRRLDLTIDPPPDLAIEVDVTSKTGLDAYQSFGVPELWRFEDGQLRISLLQQGQYHDASASPHFPNFPIVDSISQCIDRSRTEGRSQILKAFRQWVREFAKTTD